MGEIYHLLNQNVKALKYFDLAQLSIYNLKPSKRKLIAQFIRTIERQYCSYKDVKTCLCVNKTKAKLVNLGFLKKQIDNIKSIDEYYSDYYTAIAYRRVKGKCVTR